MTKEKKTLIVYIPRDRTKTIDELVKEEVDKLNKIFTIHEVKRPSSRYKDGEFEIRVTFSSK